MSWLRGLTAGACVLSLAMCTWGCEPAVEVQAGDVSNGEGGGFGSVPDPGNPGDDSNPVEGGAEDGVGTEGGSGLPGDSPVPEHCAPIPASNPFWEVCSSGEGTCVASFTDGSGCDVVCASADLVCVEAFTALGSCVVGETVPLGCQESGSTSSAVCHCGVETNAVPAPFSS